MNSRERLVKALNHEEPDRVPFDLGASLITGIHKIAYQNVLKYIGMKEEEIPIFDVVQQLAAPSENFLQRINVDTRNLSPKNSSKWQLHFEEDDHYRYFTDEWGIVWRMPLGHGLYFDMYKNPLADVEDVRDIDKYTFPDPDDENRYLGLRERALKLYEQGYAIVMSSISAGIMELGAWLRGFENFYMDLVLRPELISRILDKALEIKMRYWSRVLEEVGDLIQVVQEADDLGTQNSLLISPEMYRKLIKPRHKELFDFIHSKTKAAIFLHCCGAIYELIPDLIEVGVDILNPVQFTAKNMEASKLKREFGNDIAFWGGGVDTQNILPHGTPQQVKDSVRRQIEIFAPGGGFVFNTVHNIQPDVPPENFIAMLEALEEYGKY
ncbi:Uroporphyrinogen decarboxylase (URO-D) [Neomoorella glycerini]|uniref:Uroporphyrinogen decarboxylase (URO-D) n=1 Tax=Neomoorella glycerini TaxID=55779 RepID=A0A6I5ZN56_9FIRM|nr:uroporphyrinogen decarboxylase family protein [Moorella glycerini]QGP91263.1 Uroporphyrinogen decarboxylase (URO-D) [Moorella glycerini]